MRRIRSTCRAAALRNRRPQPPADRSATCRRAPLPSRESTTNGLSSAPSSTLSPFSTLAFTCRNHSPQPGGVVFEPSPGRGVTGCFSPSLLDMRAKRLLRTAPVWTRRQYAFPAASNRAGAASRNPARPRQKSPAVFDVRRRYLSKYTLGSSVWLRIAVEDDEVEIVILRPKRSAVGKAISDSSEAGTPSWLFRRGARW